MNLFLQSFHLNTLRRSLNYICKFGSCTWSYPTSLVPRPHPARVSLPLLCAILKAICAGIGFGSGTETTIQLAKVRYILREFDSKLAMVLFPGPVQLFVAFIVHEENLGTRLG